MFTAQEKAKARAKRARSQAKAARKVAEAKSREEQDKARLARAARKEQKRLARKVNRVNKPTVQAVKPVTPITQRHIEELRRRDWLRERPSQGHTQAWVNAISPVEEEYEMFFLDDLEEHSDGSTSPNTIRWGEFEAVAIQIAKSAEALERKLAAERKWAQRELGWQHMLVFIKAKYGVDLTDLTCEEWESKQLSPERVKALGVRSPKLSKAMVAFGVPQKEVAVLLSANYTKNTISSASTKVLEDKSSCKEQGNSIHYSSCQATDSRAQWSGGNSYYKVHEELDYMGKSLFLWVVGEPMSKNGTGFEARAKLRVMYADRNCKQVAGLYIDRPYGKHQMLLDNLDELQAWWSDWCEAKGLGQLPILIPPVWNRDNGAGNDFQYMYGGRYPKKLYCPSAEAGYQDTLSHGIGGYNCFVDVTCKSEGLLLQAYTKRAKFGGVYYSPLSAVTYNPQKQEVAVPLVRLPKARKPVSQKYKDLYADCRKMFGATNFEEVNNTFYFSLKGIRLEVMLYTGSTSNPSGYYVCGIKRADTHQTVVEIDSWGEITVESDLPELGFSKAVQLPYKGNPHLEVTENLVYTFDSEEFCFGKAVDLRKGQEVYKMAKEAGFTGFVNGYGNLEMGEYRFRVDRDRLVVSKKDWGAWTEIYVPSTSKKTVTIYTYQDLGFEQAVDLKLGEFAYKELKDPVKGFPYVIYQTGSYVEVKHGEAVCYYASRGFGDCIRIHKEWNGIPLYEAKPGQLNVLTSRYPQLGFAKAVEIPN